LPRFGDRRRIRVGLLGGSFNPAHAGHRHLAELARRRFALDEIWLLVSPGNVLKPTAGMAPFGDRLASARVYADGRRIIASGIETALGTRYTIDTLRKLQRRFPRVAFVWVMGADILEQLPRWHRWLDFVRRVPLAVLPRPTYNHRALAGMAARRMRSARRADHSAPALAGQTAPAWTFLPSPQHPASASAIRAARKGDVP
jgi:nicotinate-nucleotide adenylyltransferase